MTESVFAQPEIIDDRQLYIDLMNQMFGIESNLSEILHQYLLVEPKEHLAQNFAEVFGILPPVEMSKKVGTLHENVGLYRHWFDGFFQLSFPIHKSGPYPKKQIVQSLGEIGRDDVVDSPELLRVIDEEFVNKAYYTIDRYGFHKDETQYFASINNLQELLEIAPYSTTFLPAFGRRLVDSGNAHISALANSQTKKIIQREEWQDMNGVEFVDWYLFRTDELTRFRVNSVLGNFYSENGIMITGILDHEPASEKNLANLFVALQNSQGYGTFESQQELLTQLGRPHKQDKKILDTILERYEVIPNLHPDDLELFGDVIRDSEYKYEVIPLILENLAKKDQNKVRAYLRIAKDAKVGDEYNKYTEAVTKLGSSRLHHALRENTHDGFIGALENMISPQKKKKNPLPVEKVAVAKEPEPYVLEEQDWYQTVFDGLDSKGIDTKLFEQAMPTLYGLMEPIEDGAKTMGQYILRIWGIDGGIVDAGIPVAINKFSQDIVDYLELEKGKTISKVFTNIVTTKNIDKYIHGALMGDGIKDTTYRDRINDHKNEPIRKYVRNFVFPS